MAEDSEWPKKKYASEQERKSHKPVLEKRRRQRINKSLEALKSLLLEAVKSDGAHHSKLEKADILEMTVRHLKDLQRKQLNVAMTVDPNVIRRYQGGFSECSSEVKRYLSTIDGIKPEVKSRLVDHLNNCSNSINNLSQGMGQGQALLQTPVSPPLYGGQVIEVKPMQMSPPDVTVIPYTTPAPPVHGYMHAQSQSVQHQQQNQRFHIINQQQPNQIHVVNPQQPNQMHVLHPQQQQLIIQTPVSSAFRQVSPSLAPLNQHTLSPVYSTSSPLVSPIRVTDQQIDVTSPNFIHHRRTAGATVSSPSFESESFNSSNETASTNDEIENKHLGGGNNLQTWHETGHNSSDSFTNNNTDSSLTNTPVIHTAKIKSTKLFCHSTPKGRPLADGNIVSSENRLSQKNSISELCDKENCPVFQLPSNGNQVQRDNMWRPW